jgi:hypothetical protein
MKVCLSKSQAHIISAIMGIFPLSQFHFDLHQFSNGFLLQVLIILFIVTCYMLLNLFLQCPLSYFNNLSEHRYDVNAAVV